MRNKLHFAILLGAVALLPTGLAAQSDDNSVPLGDVARALRKSKNVAAPSQTVIDNDNFSKVMDQAESQKAKGTVHFSFQGTGRDLQVSSPDVTCSLSFNAQGPLLPDPLVAQDLPRNELAKLDGPAIINGDSLEVTVYNGTGWNVKEITVGLTILRRPAATAAYYGSAQLRPAAAGSDAPAEKRSDLTVLYHLKGTASPFATAIFSQNLGATLGPDQDWHWAIVQAQGTPPR
jgi:hypothetical protein